MEAWVIIARLLLSGLGYYPVNAYGYCCQDDCSDQHGCDRSGTKLMRFCCCSALSLGVDFSGRNGKYFAIPCNNRSIDFQIPRSKCTSRTKRTPRDIFFLSQTHIHSLPSSSSNNNSRTMKKRNIRRKRFLRVDTVKSCVTMY